MTETGDPTDLIRAAVERARSALVEPGDWLSGDQRRTAALQVRDARTNPLDEARRQAISPTAVEGAHPAVDDLGATAIEVVHRIATDPGRLTQSWAVDAMNQIGQGAYTELVGVAALTAAIDTYAWALGEPEPTLDDPVGGDPAGIRPDDVGDVGAWVAQSTAVGRANVSRSLSLVPVTNRTWVQLVQALYSRGDEFNSLEWDRALSRPQVELVAARTTAELECFY